MTQHQLSSFMTILYNYWLKLSTNSICLVCYFLYVHISKTLLGTVCYSLDWKKKRWYPKCLGIQNPIDFLLKYFKIRCWKPSTHHSLLNPIGQGRGGGDIYFYPLVLVGSDLVSWIFFKNFQTFLEVKIDTFRFSQVQLIESYKNCPLVALKIKAFCILFSFRLSFIWLNSVFILSL